MRCIEIIDVPKGPAPLEIRTAWVGLRLPVSQPFGEVTGGKTIGVDGYVVDVVDAVEILGLYNKDAALWWRTNIDIEPGRTFIFDSGACRLFTGLPSITAPLGHDGSTKTVREFIEALSGWSSAHVSAMKRIHASRIEWLCSSFINPLTRDEQEELEQSALTRPIVLLLSNLVASEWSARVQGATSEEYLQDLLNRGHGKLQDMYRLAVAYGIDVAEREIDRPLSFTDIAIRDGIVEQVKGGLRLTSKGETAARRPLDDDDAS